MGEISEALSRARQEDGDDRRERAPESAPPRKHAPLYDAPVAKGREEGPQRDIPRHEIGSLREPAPTESPVESRPVPVSDAPPPPAASPSTEARYCQIPTDHEADWIYRICAVEPDSPAAVRFRHFAVRMRALLDEARLPSVLVTSAVQGEGKTTVAINLALALASIAPEVRIALVDTDLRRGVAGQVLGHKAKRGVEDVMAGRATIEDVTVQTSAGRLDVLPTAHSTSDAHSLLGASADKLFAQLHARYDYVVCDGPPVLPVPDTPLLAKHVGGCLAVVASGRTRHAAFRDVVDLIPRAKWFGVFMNESTMVSSKERYGYYRTYQPDEAEEAEEAEEEPAGETTTGLEAIDDEVRATAEGSGA